MLVVLRSQPQTWRALCLQLWPFISCCPQPLHAYKPGATREGTLSGLQLLCPDPEEDLQEVFTATMLVSITAHQKLSISPGKNQTTNTTLEPNLKQTLFNTIQDNGHWPGPYWGFPEIVTNHVSWMLIQANPARLHAWGQAHILMDSLPSVSGTACATGTTTLFMDVRTHGVSCEQPAPVGRRG